MRAADAEPESVNFFAYGTLEFPAVMEAVTGCTHSAAEALLEDFARVLLAGRPYPGIARRPGEHTTGVLYSPLEPRAFALLDRFEDDFYERVRVEVETPDGARHSAHTYIIPPQHADLLTGEPWSRTRFAAQHLPAYLDQCRRFRERALADLSEA